MLKERDKLYNAIKFVDISSPDYDPVDNQDLDYETVCDRAAYLCLMLLILISFYVFTYINGCNMLRLIF